jgi:transcriptional regulator with XRE-family HTH domain
MTQPMTPYTGEHLKKLRVQANLTQVQLAQKLGLTQPAVSALENGAHPSAEQQKKLSEVFGNSEDAVSNPFGDWVKREREKLNLTVQELAVKSKVSVPGIYNIEAGRNTNPRQVTKDKLAKALGAKIPGDVTAIVKNQSEIDGMGAFTDFEPFSPDDLPKTAGIYVLYDVTERPVYVGEGGDISKRIKSHNDKFWFKRPIVDTASYIEVSDEKLRVQIEKLLIKFLKSNAVLNKQNVDRP